MLKHDLRTSEKVASWPIEVRYFWVLLWGYVDDHGKARDNPLLVKSDCFPLDTQITGEVIDEWLDLLATEEVVARYSVSGQDFLQVVNWKEHQRPPHPTPDVLPGSDHPQATLRQLHASRMKDAGSTHASFTPVLGSDWVGIGSGFGYESSPAVTNIESEFEQAWSHWPKKVQRKAALVAYKKAIKKKRWDFIVDAITRFGDAYAATTDRQYTPALSAWLNDERWDDELPVASSGRKLTRTEENLLTVAQYAQQEQKGIE